MERGSHHTRPLDIMTPCQALASLAPPASACRGREGHFDYLQPLLLLFSFSFTCNTHGSRFIIPSSFFLLYLSFVLQVLFFSFLTFFFLSVHRGKKNQDMHHTIIKSFIPPFHFCVHYQTFSARFHIFQFTHR